MTKNKDNNVKKKRIKKKRQPGGVYFERSNNLNILTGVFEELDGSN